MEVQIISGIVLLTLYLLISEKISVDLTAIGIMVLLVVTRILTPKEAVAGFANPAVITVGAMFIVSKGMMRTGGVEFIARKVSKAAGGNFYKALIIILCTVAVGSAFINNTPIVILFIPVVMTMCCEYGISPSKFLIPVSYASILAGTCSLIGTSTNIIVSDLSVQFGYAPLSMFELSIIGLPIAIIGILFLLFAAPKVLPDLASPVCKLEDGEDRQYLAELVVPADSPLIGTSPIALTDQYASLQVIELSSKEHIYHPKRDYRLVNAGDILLIKAAINDLMDVIRNEELTLPSSAEGLTFSPLKDAPIVAELVIPPHSSYLYGTLEETGLLDDPDLHILAVKRSNSRIQERQVKTMRLRTGDIILIWCPERKIESLRGNNEFMLMEDVHEELVHKRKAVWSVMNFIGMVGTATLGFADIMTCALTAAFLMIITGCLQMRDAYSAIQGKVLLLIAGTIALGAGMQKTGASQIYAEAFLQVFSGFSPMVILGAMILLSSISTQILSNNATAVLLLPIAISTAIGIGVDPRPFIIGICFGASACFATPVGYQTNLLVYGPGGYRFIDYLKLGLPLNAFVVLASTLTIPLVWPF